MGSTINSSEAPMRIIPSILLACAPVLAASLIGAAATVPNVTGWYAGLAKPWFTPPNQVFGPVWTGLYVLMAYAFYRVLRKPAPDGRRAELTAFLTQIALNALWSVAFFGERSPVLGLLVIAALWVAIGWTLALFWVRDRVSGACLVPYFLWSSFAALLNLEVWRLNG